MDVSVAITTFNGEKYLNDQLDSILLQLNENDEIIISDDGSTDSTLEIISSYISKDNRIKLYTNKRLGIAKNFQYVIEKCSKELIFLSDQDDIWTDDKIELVKEAFIKSNAKVVLHNGVKFFENDNDIEECLIPKMRQGVLRNILKSSYWGCCIALRREFVKVILPFPEGIVAYDQWIGLMAEKGQVSEFIEKPLIRHRVHENNVSKALAFNKKLIFRVNIITRYIKHIL